MKKLFTLIAFTILGIGLLAQQDPFTSVQTGPWGEPSTWGLTGTAQPGVNVPAYDDNILIVDGTLVTASMSDHITLTGNITINDGGAMKLGGSFVLTLSGTNTLINGRFLTEGADVDVTSTLNLGSTSYTELHDFTVNSGATLSLSGEMIVLQNFVIVSGATTPTINAGGSVRVLGNFTNDQSTQVDGELLVEGTGNINANITGDGAIKAVTYSTVTGVVFSLPTNPTLTNGYWYASCTWNGSSNSNWDNSANWYGGLPTSGTAAAISYGATTGPVINSTESGSAKSLYINGAYVTEIKDGGTLEIGGYTATGSELSVGGDGIVMVEGATAKLVVGTVTTPADGLNIAIDGKVTVGPNGKMTILNPISNAGTTNLIIKSSNGTGGDASLIYSGGTPKATVERSALHEGWHLMATATTDVFADAFYIDDAHDAWLIFFNESGLSPPEYGSNAEDWTYIVNDLETVPINRGQGYGYWWRTNPPRATAGLVEFKGDLTSGDVTVPLSFTTEGYNLIGNPYSCAIDLAALGSQDAAIENSIWVWDQTANDYLYGFTGDIQDVYTGTLNSRFLPMGQGAFVKTTAAVNFVFNETSRAHGAQQAFYKTSYRQNRFAGGIGHFVKIKVSRDQIKDEITVGFGDNGTTGLDNGWDISKFFGGNDKHEIYLEEADGHKYSIDHLKTLEEDSERIVQMGFVANENGEYVLNANLSSLADAQLTLEDLKTGLMHDLRENPIYTFTASTEDNPLRFLLHFLYITTGIDDPVVIEENPIDIYAWDKSVYVRNNANDHSTAQVLIYDLYGREILATQSRLGNLTRIPINLSNSYIVVKVLRQGSVTTEKVFIR